MVENIKIVIGANFGDEGKGLMTNYFCRQAARKGDNCLVVLHNGGAQRGHTVEYPDNSGRALKRHVFHHFGSGTLEGAATYFADQFILNPILFRQEWEQLEGVGITPKVYAHPDCRVTTPYDMMLNQIVEESRGTSKHGSCGMGIYETIKRYDDILTISDTLFEQYNMSPLGRKAVLQYLRNTWLMRGVIFYNATEKWGDVIHDNNIIVKYLDDLEFMFSKITFSKDDILQNFQTVVFEGGQGLMLDKDNKAYFPHLTPSNTGMANPKKILTNISQSVSPQIEACYVTRSYLTRHGAGRLDGECSKEEISDKILKDITNVYNQHQDSLRYAPLDIALLYSRIHYDGLLYEMPDIKKSLAITHLNENEKILDNGNRQFIFSKNDTVYESYTPYLDDIKSYIC